LIKKSSRLPKRIKRINKKNGWVKLLSLKTKYIIVKAPTKSPRRLLAKIKLIRKNSEENKRAKKIGRIVNCKL
jgi:hypothetical protein